LVIYGKSASGFRDSELMNEYMRVVNELIEILGLVDCDHRERT